MRYWKLMGEYNAETTTLSAFAGTGRASPYQPDEDARLVALRLMTNRAAATSLLNHITVRLTSTSFQPNAIECGVTGGGLQTAPVAAVPSMDFAVDQPVKSGTPIKMEGQNISETDTPVTVSVLLYGFFDNGRK